VGNDGAASARLRGLLLPGSPAVEVLAPRPLRARFPRRLSHKAWSLVATHNRCQSRRVRSAANGLRSARASHLLPRVGAPLVLDHKQFPVRQICATTSAHRRELGITLEMLVGFVEQVSVDLGASPYIATNRTQSLHALSGSLGLVAAVAIKRSRSAGPRTARQRGPQAVRAPRRRETALTETRAAEGGPRRAVSQRARGPCAPNDRRTHFAARIYA
jgi:hypothetical protein